MDVLAVIPAVAAASRGDFAGRSLAMHALEQARAARNITSICIVTADARLIRAAADLGVDTLSPPADDDVAAQLGAALEALRTRGIAPSLAVILDPAFPLRTVKTIDGAIEHLLRCGADSLVAVCPLTDALWVHGEGGAAQPLNSAPAERRYVQTAAITGVRVGVFEQTGELPAGRTVLYEVPATTALRLDDNDADWQRAELLAGLNSAARGRALLRGVRLLVLDFDGVMTDNRVLVLEDGREAVACNRGDGMGIGLLKAAGVPVAVISKEVNPVVGARCRKLNIPFLQGIDDKLAEFERMIAEHGLERAQVAYMGNDVNDLACMAAAGVAIAPVDGHPLALRAASLITVAAGGQGAVREVCDLLLAAIEEDDGPPV